MPFWKVDARAIAASFGFKSWPEIRTAINAAAGALPPAGIELEILTKTARGSRFEISPIFWLKSARELRVGNVRVVVGDDVRLELVGKSRFAFVDGKIRLTPTSVKADYLCPSCGGKYTIDLNPSRGLTKDCVICKPCCKSIVHKCESCREKFDASMIEAHGTRYPLQNPEILARMQQTMIERYGAKTSGESPALIDKRDRTMLRRHGRINYFEGINPWQEFRLCELDAFRHATSMGERALAAAITESNATRGLTVHSCLSRRFVHSSKSFGTCVIPDVYLPQAKLVIEFYGDYWHGNPSVFSGDRVLYGGLTRADVNARDAMRVSVIESELDCTVRIVWESDWKRDPAGVVMHLEEIIRERVQASRVVE